MKIIRKWFFDMKEWPSVKDIVIVVDVWACTTNINIILAKKPQSLFLSSDKNLERTIDHCKKSILIGQTRLKNYIFDCSNEPFDISRIKLKNKVVILSTFNGAKVFEKYSNSVKKRVFCCSINNLESLLLYLNTLNKPKNNIYIIMSGESGKPNIEDHYVGFWIESMLRGNKINLRQKKHQLIGKLLDYQPYHFRKKSPKEYYPFIVQQKFDFVPFAFINNSNLLEITVENF